jgi:hypothetical protein
VIRLELLFGLVDLALFIYCLIDLIQTPEHEVRNLPKMTWVLIVVFVPLAGPLAWLAAGRPLRTVRPAGSSAASRYPEYDRPGRAIPSNPDDDEDFLRQVRARAEEQRRRAAEQKKQPGDAEPPADGV